MGLVSAGTAATLGFREGSAQPPPVARGWVVSYIERVRRYVDVLQRGPGDSPVRCDGSATKFQADITVDFELQWGVGLGWPKWGISV